MGNDLTAFIEAVGRRVGHGDPTNLARVTRATLRALGRHLGGMSHALGDFIPAALQAELEAGEFYPQVGPAAFYLKISNELGIRVGLALEIAQSVVAELADRLTEAGRQRLRRRLPPAWATFIDQPGLHEIPLGRGHVLSRHHRRAMCLLSGHGQELGVTPSVAMA
ncbi:MAG: DUF2267 domain-containing protein [Myxococcota bacterium]